MSLDHHERFLAIRKDLTWLLKNTKPITKQFSTCNKMVPSFREDPKTYLSN